MTLREEHPVWSSIYVRLNYMDRLGLDKLYDTLIDPAYAHSLDPHKSAFAYGIKDEYPGANFFDWVAHNVSRDILLISLTYISKLCADAV